MIRIFANIMLMVCLLIALQSHSDYLFMRNTACPPEIRETVDRCNEKCRTCPAEHEPENPGRCCASSADYTDPPDVTRCADATGAACVPSPCPDPVQRAKCCVLVHPFWIELSVRPDFSPETVPVPLISGKQADTDSPHILTVQEYIPPWGVHPIISTTVLRI